MLYFSHDTDASSDEKLTFMRLTYGGAAVDAYWVLLERIYRDEKPLPFWADLTLPATLAHKLAVTSDELRAWVEQMVAVGLLDRDGDGLTSERASAAIAEYHAFKQSKAAAGRKSGESRRAKSNKHEHVFNECSTSVEPRKEKKRNINNARCPKCGNLLLKKQDGTGRVYCQAHGIVEV